jgi:hypothetical protein
MASVSRRTELLNRKARCIRAEPLLLQGQLEVARKGSLGLRHPQAAPLVGDVGALGRQGTPSRRSRNIRWAPADRGLGIGTSAVQRVIAAG